MEFINTGMDERILKSLDVENPSEELIKAMNKQGLVQKEIQVTGKNGQTFTRKQWVKAGETKGNPQTIKSTTKESELKARLKQKTDELKNLSSQMNSNNKAAGQLNSVATPQQKQQYDKLVDEIGDINYELGQLKKQYVSDKKQPQQEQTEVESSETPVSKLKVGDSFDLVIHGDSQGTVKITSITKGHTDGPISFANYHIKGTLNGKPYDEIVSQSFSPHKVVKKETSSPDNQKTSSDSKSDSTTDDRLDVLDQIEKVSGTGKFSETAKKHGITWENSSSDIVNNTRAGFALVQAVKSGKLSLDDLKSSNSSEDSVKFDKTKSGTVGGIQVGKELATVVKTANGKKLREVTDPDTGKVYEIHTDTSSNKPDGIVAVEKSDGKLPDFTKMSDKELENLVKLAGMNTPNTYNSQVGSGALNELNKRKALTTKTKGKTKGKSSMIEDVFSGNHSYSDGKSALMGLLGKGYSKKDIMEQAVQFGITWKPNDHEGINWMRASMAIQKHFNK